MFQDAGADGEAEDTPPRTEETRSDNSDEEKMEDDESDAAQQDALALRGFASSDEEPTTTPPPQLLASPSEASSFALEISPESMHNRGSDDDEKPSFELIVEDLPERLARLAKALKFQNSGNQAELARHITKLEDLVSGNGNESASQERGETDCRPREIEQRIGEPKKDQWKMAGAQMQELNEELTETLANLAARQEESQHIHGLLIERAENAARHILQLERRVQFLERELQDGDDELNHLRICLKAVEIQLPPHPDLDLQRCVAIFKEDYKMFRQKRINRSSLSGPKSQGVPETEDQTTYGGKRS